jgi:hypothetical protein
VHRKTIAGVAGQAPIRKVLSGENIGEPANRAAQLP